MAASFRPALTGFGLPPVAWKIGRTSALYPLESLATVSYEEVKTIRTLVASHTAGSWYALLTKRLMALFGGTY